jgi:hypothetical protein
MNRERDDPAASPSAYGDTDELDRLRLALLHERSRAENAERELAALRAEQGEQTEQAGPPAPVTGSRMRGLARRVRGRR